MRLRRSDILILSDCILKLSFAITRAVQWRGSTGDIGQFTYTWWLQKMRDAPYSAIEGDKWICFAAFNGRRSLNNIDWS